jgi:prophage antirepressor-like protein
MMTVVVTVVKGNGLQVFDYNENLVRVVDKDGEIWWVLKDICNVLEIANHRDAASRLDDDEKGVGFTDSLGGKQELTVINEPGLYKLIFRSNKPEAKVFTRWVTHEVLPAIRRAGGHFAGQDRKAELFRAAELISKTPTARMKYLLPVLNEILPGKYNGAEEAPVQNHGLHQVNDVADFLKSYGSVENEPTNKVYRAYQGYCTENGIAPIPQGSFSVQVKRCLGACIKDKKIRGKKYRVFATKFKVD